MESHQLDLGVPEDVNVESFGEPGSRTFRILIDTGQGQVSIWLEKEQVAMLGSAITEILERLPSNFDVTPQRTTPGVFVGELEVKVGSLSVGYDAVQEGFSIEASEFESPFGITEIALLVGTPVFKRMRDDIVQIVSSGRPRCPLCGRPLTDGGHFCPGSNGHAKLTVSD